MHLVCPLLPAPSHQKIKDCIMLFSISPWYYSRPKRNRIEWFRNFFLGGGGGGGWGVNKVNYGLCENSEFAQSVNLPIFPSKW